MGIELIHPCFLCDFLCQCTYFIVSSRSRFHGSSFSFASVNSELDLSESSQAVATRSGRWRLRRRCHSLDWKKNEKAIKHTRFCYEICEWNEFVCLPCVVSITHASFVVVIREAVSIPNERKSERMDWMFRLPQVM